MHGYLLAWLRPVSLLVHSSGILAQRLVQPTLGWDFPLSINSRQCPTDMLTGQPSTDLETFFSADSSLHQVDKLTINLVLLSSLKFVAHYIQILFASTDGPTIFLCGRVGSSALFSAAPARAGWSNAATTRLALSWNL